PNLLRIFFIAGAEHKQPITIGHLRDVGILFHDCVGKFAGCGRGRRLRNRESWRRSRRVLGLLLHLVPTVRSTVVLLVIVKSKFLDLLLRGWIALRQIYGAGRVKKTI